MTRSGAAAACLPVCKYFEGMRFLHDEASNLPTHSNFDISPTYSQMSESSISDDRLECPSPPNSIHATPSFAVARASSNSALLPATYEKPLLQEKPPKQLKRKNIPEKISPGPYLQHMQEIDERMVRLVEGNREAEQEEATAFCLSLIPVLKDFDKKKLRLTKIKIQQLLHDIEFGDE